MSIDVPQLTGESLAAVRHRGSHMQIIASAGAGKTEVVSQRVADLLAKGVDPRSIVAFTFTERAAGELKTRIADRARGRLGPGVLDTIGQLFMGTIHAYCFRLLQQHVPRYESYDVLDDNRLTALLVREANRLELKQFDPSGRNRLYASIQRFLKAVDIVENELLDVDCLPEPLRSVLAQYYATLERYRLLTYGMQISRAVDELDDGVGGIIHQTLRHLIVDEYQDINPAQDRLIEALVGPDVEMCIVGDDQQAIYQWRGSNVSSIVQFAERFAPVATFELTVNRRSRPQLIAAANTFAESIPERIDKTMTTARESEGPEPEIAAWAADTEEEEAGYIANFVLDLIDGGVEPRDIGVLVRSRAAYRRLLEHFDTFDIPVQPGGRTGLFDRPEAEALGKTVCWLVEHDWRSAYANGVAIGEGDLMTALEDAFRFGPGRRRPVREFLRRWKALVPKTNRTANLVSEVYAFLEELEVKSWDLDEPTDLVRLGTLARFTELLADYEAVRRRSRADPESPGQQVGGQGRGTWYYTNLATHIVNYAQGAYEGFDGEKDFALNAVDLTTVHRAKGLEWPVVFVPSMTKRRFPSPYAGRDGDWLIPRELFEAPRYEGSDADERRLFYVAMTRARDWLSVSRHARITRQSTRPSAYFDELKLWHVGVDDVVVPAVLPRTLEHDHRLRLSFSELSSFLECGTAFRLRNLLGFQPRLAPELGYGKAIHHVMRTVAEETQATGSVPDEIRADELLDREFFLATADKFEHARMRTAAGQLVKTYVEKHAEDLRRVWETERPFELHLDGVTISGRADVILDREAGMPTGLAIVDYKTSTGDVEDHALQLRIHAEAGRREGLDVLGGYVHDLKGADRESIEIGEHERAAAVRQVEEAAAAIRGRDYRPSPGPGCRRCEVRTVCRHAAP